MATPIGILGGIRGTLFANFGGASWNDQPFKCVVERHVDRAPDRRLHADRTTAGTGHPVYGDPVLVDGFRLVNTRASYGIGLQTFALGFPIHFDWSWRTLLQHGLEDVTYAQVGGSAAFRRSSSRSGLATTSDQGLGTGG